MRVLRVITLTWGIVPLGTLTTRVSRYMRSGTGG